MGNTEYEDARAADAPSEASRTLEQGEPAADVPLPLGMFRAVTITMACTLAMVNNVSDVLCLAVGAD